MRTLKIKTTVYTDAGVNAFPGVYSEIVQAILANNMVFVTVPIMPSVLQDSIGFIVSKTNKAKKGSETDKTDRQIQADVCLNYLSQLAGYVLQVAATKPTLEEQIQVVQLSKFTLANTNHVPSPPLPQIEGVKGNWTAISGQAVIEWDRVEAGAASYQIFTALTDPSSPSTVWRLSGSATHKKITLDGLPYLSPVWVQVVAIGKDNEVSAPSAPVMITVA